MDRPIPPADEPPPSLSTSTPTSLQAGITALSELRVTPAGLEALLVEVASLAVSVVNGANGAGLTLFRPGQTDTLVATDAFVARIDTVQYEIGQGPCILACAQSRTVRSGAVVSDSRWPEFGHRIAALDVGSVLSLPLQTAGQVIGSINLYAHELDAFSAIAAQLGETFAAPAAVALVNARVHTAAKAAANELQTTLAARATLDQAVGIILFTERVTAETARTLIESRASAAGISVIALSRTIVDAATASAEHDAPTA